MPRSDRDAYFDVRYPFQPGRARVWKAICEHLQRHVAIDAAVLELGAGYCDFINQIRAGRKHALDSNASVKDFCAPDVTFLHADTRKVPLPDASVDVVFASNLVEHLDGDALDRTLGEVERVLRPGGTLILLQPNYYYAYRRYWDDFTHVKAWSHESLPDLLACSGYQIQRVEKRFLPFTFKSRLPASYALTRLYLALPWRPFAAQMLVVAQRR